MNQVAMIEQVITVLVVLFTAGLVLLSVIGAVRWSFKKRWSTVSFSKFCELTVKHYVDENRFYEFIRKSIWIILFTVGILGALVSIALAVKFTIEIFNHTPSLFHDHKKIVAEKLNDSEANHQLAVGAQEQSTQEKGGNVGDSIAAISLVITAVAAILALGTSWFATVQKSLDEKLRSVNDVLAKNKRKEELQLVENKVRAKLARAKHSILNWTIATGASLEGIPLYVAQINSELEILLVDDLDVRTPAFIDLATMLDPWPDGLVEEKAVVRDYSEACHNLAIARIFYLNKGLSPSEFVDLEKKGLACKIFDQSEIEKFV